MKGCLFWCMVHFLSSNQQFLSSKLLLKTKFQKLPSIMLLTNGLSLKNSRLSKKYEYAFIHHSPPQNPKEDNNEFLKQQRERFDADCPIIAEEVWREKSLAHKNRVLDILGGKLGLGGKIGYDVNHPIYNFIFEYYHFKPRRLLIDYTPGFGVVLANAKPKEASLFQKNFIETVEGIYFCPSTLKPGRLKAFQWTCDFLKQVAERPPVFFCYGLHEWAMLYQPEGASPVKKHQSLSLRLSQEELNSVVESRTIKCTHFDAFRFFTPEARPLNQHNLTRETQVLMDQPGCVHATMDLFKWALKLLPFCPSELLGDCLDLALEARVLDIRASPYDAKAFSDDRFDLSPIHIETAEGRKLYQEIQQGLWMRSVPLRQRLVSYHEEVLKAAGPILDSSETCLQNSSSQKSQQKQSNYEYFR
mmetsp:Transcript_38952/g.49713  ORF Transcript_38952/g.49713 Transcript_38952/m.49713 type:complete len:417 (-) Transcript_38952:255-1505(-)